MAETDELLTTAQVAKISGRAIGTVNRWASEGKLAIAMKLPGETGANLFRRSDVEALIAEGCLPDCACRGNRVEPGEDQ